MKQILTGLLVFGLWITVSAQAGLNDKIQSAWNRFNNDQQLKYSLTGICVMDAATGKVLYESNSNIGMAPASTQKIITTIAAYEALGPGFQYQTGVGYTGHKNGNTINGDLVITGTGDPTLASFRYNSTKETGVLKNIATALKNTGIDSVSGSIIGVDKGFDFNAIPPGWTWGDMGNYYGAGVWAINWNENQYDLILKTGRQDNDPVTVLGSNPVAFSNPAVINNVATGKPNTGDASIIYTDPFSNTAVIQGKLEPNRSRFTVSGSISNADLFALKTIKTYLDENNILISGEPKTSLNQFINKEASPASITNIYTISSPPMDSIVYWFLRKSVNLYGEALLRTIGMEKKGEGSTKQGLEWIDSFYTANGFDTEAMHLYDGSGLSPANRITPYALAKALYFAKDKSWYPAFYDALPLYNGMKLKSGTIARVKCFAGYHTSGTGQKYIVALMVNNYNGSPSAIVDKMFAVLNTLK